MSFTTKDLSPSNSKMEEDVPDTDSDTLLEDSLRKINYLKWEEEDLKISNKKLLKRDDANKREVERLNGQLESADEQSKRLEQELENLKQINSKEIEERHRKLESQLEESRQEVVKFEEAIKKLQLALQTERESFGSERIKNQKQIEALKDEMERKTQDRFKFQVFVRLLISSSGFPEDLDVDNVSSDYLQRLSSHIHRLLTDEDKGIMTQLEKVFSRKQEEARLSTGFPTIDNLFKSTSNLSAETPPPILSPPHFPDYYLDLGNTPTHLINQPTTRSTVPSEKLEDKAHLALDSKLSLKATRLKNRCTLKKMRQAMAKAKKYGRCRNVSHRHWKITAHKIQSQSRRKRVGQSVLSIANCAPILIPSLPLIPKLESTADVKEENLVDGQDAVDQEITCASPQVDKAEYSPSPRSNESPSSFDQDVGIDVKYEVFLAPAIEAQDLVVERASDDRSGNLNTAEAESSSRKRRKPVLKISKLKKKTEHLRSEPFDLLATKRDRKALHAFEKETRDGSFQCRCGKEYKQKGHLVRHVTVNSGVVHECKLCKEANPSVLKIFKRKEDLKAHVRDVHERRSSVCPYCGKTLRFHSLHQHIREIHHQGETTRNGKNIKIRLRKRK